jgi:histidinol-phosphate phosphatase family protein
VDDPDGDPLKPRLADGSALGLRLLHDAGFELFVVTHQARVAMGRLAEAAMQGVEQALRARLAAVGVPLAGFYYCPHAPDAMVSVYRLDCGCRKPRPGLLLRAAAEHGANLSRSWMIGDILDDVEAGRLAGCRTVLVRGAESEWRLRPLRVPDYYAADLASAACYIVSDAAR